MEYVSCQSSKHCADLVMKQEAHGITSIHATAENLADISSVAVQDEL